MREVCIYMTDRQIKYVKNYAATNRISFGEAVRIAVSEKERNDRNKEVMKLMRSHIS